MAGNATVELVLKLVDDLSPSLTKISGVLAGFATKAAGAFAAFGATVVYNTQQAQVAATRLDVAYNNLNKGLGLTRRQLDDLATEIQRTTTVEDDAVKAAEALLLTFDKVRGQAFERTIRVAADLNAALGVDMVTAARMLGRALQDPSSGMQALARAGLKLSEAEQKVIKDLDDAGKSIEAQNALLQQLERRYGGTAAAMANTLGGALTQLKNDFGDLFELEVSETEGPVAALQDLRDLLRDPETRKAVKDLATIFVDSMILMSQAAIKVVDALKVLRGIWTTLKFNAGGDVGPGDLLRAGRDLGINEDELRRRLGYGNPSGGRGAGRKPKEIQTLEEVTVTDLGPKAIKKQEEAVAKLKAQIKDTIEQTRWLQRGMAEGLGPALIDVGDAFTDIARATDTFDVLDQKSKKLSKTLQDDLAAEQEAQLQMIRNAVDGIQNALTNVFTNGIKGAKSFLVAVLNVFAQIAAQIASLSLLKVFGLGGSGGGWLGKLLGGVVKGATGKAGGGWASGLTMVGEEGPELALFPPGSRVFNKRQLAAMGGGGGSGLVFSPVNNITVSGGDGRTTRAEIEAVLARNNAMMREDVVRLLQNNRIGRIR